MRLEGRMRLGYFPLHQREAQRMRRFLQFPNEPASALDPCAGTGAALAAITDRVPPVVVSWNTGAGMSASPSFS